MDAAGLAAARSLGRPVRATVKQLSDDELVVAQGQENIERKDLSYLRARPVRCKARREGFLHEQTIMSAVSTDKASLSKLISVATSHSLSDILEAIGPAPKIGRDPWNQLLSALCDNKHALQTVRDDRHQCGVFEKKTSDERFEIALRAGRLKASKSETTRSFLTADDGSRLIPNSLRRFGSLSFIDNKFNDEFAEISRRRTAVEIYARGSKSARSGVIPFFFSTTPTRSSNPAKERDPRNVAVTEALLVL